MKDFVSHLPRLVLVSLVTVLLLMTYCYLFHENGIIPLGGKKAPNYILILGGQVLLARWFIGKKRGSSVHFLQLFGFQYLYVVVTAALSATLLYFFYESPTGISWLQEYVTGSLQELIQYQKEIIQQEGAAYYTQLQVGIRGIDAYSIAKDDLSQKLALAFLPNLLISLYYKQ
jgi:hypothetical protein